MAMTSIVSYLSLGFMGLPVFALGAAAGPAYFTGPTAGYLAGFVIAAFAIGKFYETLKPGFVSLSALMLIGHGLILSLGTLWLAFGMPSMGGAAAIAVGFMPFIAGSVLKSLMAAACVKAFASGRR